MSSSEIRPFSETGEHSYHRRAFSHDYHSPFIYHIIIKKASGCKAFGKVAGDARIAPGSPGCAKIQESDLGISGKEYEAYGNLFQFRNPDKEAVKISRKFSPEENRQKREQWLSAAAKGSVLVSPFISPAEKAIRTEAEALGSRIILITHEAFPDRYKPGAHDFDLCTQGRLLIISLGLPASTPLSRDLCLQMNALAQSFAQL